MSFEHFCVCCWVIFVISFVVSYIIYFFYSLDWVSASLEAKRWLPEESYELNEQYPAAQIARLERANKTLQPHLPLRSLHFFLEPDVPKRAFTAWLLQRCGAKIASTIGTATVIMAATSKEVVRSHADGTLTAHPPLSSDTVPRVALRWLAEVICANEVLPYDFVG